MSKLKKLCLYVMLLMLSGITYVPRYSLFCVETYSDKKFDKSLALDSAGGTLTETSTIPNNLSKMQKGSVQVTEWGNGVSFTEKLDTLAEFDMRNVYTKWLVNDHKKTLDSQCATQFTSAKFRAVCTNTATVVFTTDGSFTATQNADMSDKNVRAVVDYMRQKWIPRIGNSYVCVGSVNALSGLYTYLQSIMQYDNPEYTYSYEVGTYYGCRFVNDEVFLSNSRGSGSAFGEAVFFGEESVIEAMALPEEIRYQEYDFGRDKRLAWYSICQWGKMWDLTNDDLNSVGKGIERIVFMGSA